MGSPQLVAWDRLWQIHTNGMDCHQVSRFHMKGELDESNETKYSSPLQKILVAMVTNVRETWRDSWNVKLSICTIHHECFGEIYWLLLSAIITKSLYDVFKLLFISLRFISFDFTLENDFWAPRCVNFTIDGNCAINGNFLGNLDLICMLSW